MSAPRTRTTSLLAALLVVVSIATGTASAETSVQRARRADAALVREIGQLRREVDRAERLLRRRIPYAVVLLARLGPSLDGDRVEAIRKRGRIHEEARIERYRRFRERTRRRIETLKDQRESLAAWRWTYGVFEVCPVPAYTHIYDDFGTIVRLPKVPVHRHMGSDITAPTWSPIRAPFDGYASGSRGHLGGIEVRVRGTRGYVYNAHLIAYGSLGWVEAGDVIGYIGATGDSTAPHDHLEWHPWDGPAVDPYPLLAAACLPV